MATNTKLMGNKNAAGPHKMSAGKKAAIGAGAVGAVVGGALLGSKLRVVKAAVGAVKPATKGLAGTSPPLKIAYKKPPAAPTKPDVKLKSSTMSPIAKRVRRDKAVTKLADKRLIKQHTPKHSFDFSSKPLGAYKSSTNTRGAGQEYSKRLRELESTKIREGVAKRGR